MKKLITLFSMVLLPLLAAAQPPDTLWTRTYGGSYLDEGDGILETADGGYMIVGTTKIFEMGDTEVFLMRTDALGNVIWRQFYGGNADDWGESMVRTADGGFAIIGYTLSYGAGSGDIYLIKTDSIGNQVWQNTYGGSLSDWGACLQQTSDGGYIIVGRTNFYYGSNNYDVFLVKTDGQGNLVWENWFGGPDDDLSEYVIQTLDGGYLLTGYTVSYGAGGADIYLIKTDADGNMVWQHTYGGSLDDFGDCVLQSTDGGYLLLGSTAVTSTDWQIYLIKTNSSGDTLWTRTYGGSSYEHSKILRQTSDGGYIIIGQTFSFGAGSYDLYLLKINANADFVWQTSYGGNDYDSGRDVQQALDGGYIALGMTGSFGAGMYDVYLIRLESDYVPNISLDLVPTVLPIQIPANGGSFSFYVFANNADSASAAVTLWTGQILPDSTFMIPILGPYSLNLPPGTRAWFRHQNVPGSAPPGQYKYIGYAGVYPNTVWSSDTLIYTKLTTGSGPLNGDWANTGEDFGEAENSLITHNSALITSLSPNPFNPTTAISFKLQAPGYVNLIVYDTAGRLVTTLVNGWREAGAHDVTFDGSHIPSGLYLVKMQARNYTAVQKMVLLK